MNRTNAVRSFLPRRAGLALLASAAAALLLATPAFAGHDPHLRGRERGARSAISIGFGTSVLPCAPQRSWAEIEFDRGAQAGRSEGLRRGWQNGFEGSPFCAIAPACPPGRSRPFVDGFHAAYADAYADGYENGARACRQERRVRRPTWSWSWSW